MCRLLHSLFVLLVASYGAALQRTNVTQDSTPPPPPQEHPSVRSEDGVLGVGEALVAALIEVLQKLEPTITGPLCPYPFTQVIDECFYLQKKKLTWLQARRVCQGMGGDLAEPRYIYALQTHLADIYGPGYFWVGGTNNGPDGYWRWVSGRPVSDEDWLFSRPDNQGGDEHCLEMVTSDYPRVFNDETCNLAQRFICQYLHE